MTPGSLAVDGAEHADVRRSPTLAQVVPLDVVRAPPLRPAARGDREADAILAGARVLLVGSEPSRTDLLAQELRSRGAIVVVVGPGGEGIARAYELDADVALVDADSAARGEVVPAVTRLREHLRTRWARVMRLRWDNVCAGPDGRVDVLRLAQAIGERTAPLRALRDRVGAEASFETTVEHVGPAQWLRVLAEVEDHVRATVRMREAEATLQLAWGLVLSATWRQWDDEPLDLSGVEALAAFLTLRCGRLRVERRPPRSLDLVLPVDEALARADAEVERVFGRVPTTPPPPPDPSALVSEPPPPGEPVRADDGPAPVDRPAPETEPPTAFEPLPPLRSAPPRHGGRGWLAWSIAGGLSLLAVAALVALPPWGREPVPEVPPVADAPTPARPLPAPPAGVDTVPEPSPRGGGNPAAVDAGPQRIADWHEARRQSDLLVARAERLLADGRRADAEQAYVAATVVAPHNPHGFAGLARLTLDDGRAEEALHHVRRAIRLRPRRPAYRRLEERIRRALADRARLMPH